VVVLVDDVPADQQDNAAEAVRLCPSQALTITQD
jgi:ferredoxin